MLCCMYTAGTCGCPDLVTGCRCLPHFPDFLDVPSALTRATLCLRYPLDAADTPLPAEVCCLMATPQSSATAGLKGGAGGLVGLKTSLRFQGLATGLLREPRVWSVHHISKTWGERAMHTLALSPSSVYSFACSNICYNHPMKLSALNTARCACVAVRLQASKTLSATLCQMHESKPRVVMLHACNCL